MNVQGSWIVRMFESTIYKGCVKQNQKKLKLKKVVYVVILRQYVVILRQYVVILRHAVLLK